MKAKKAPTRPRTSYNYFFHETRCEIQEVIEQETGRRPLYAEIAKLVASRWKATNATDKAHCKSLAAKDKKRHALELIECRSRVEREEDCKKFHNIALPERNSPSTNQEIPLQQRASQQARVQENSLSSNNGDGYRHHSNSTSHQEAVQIPRGGGEEANPPAISLDQMQSLLRLLQQPGMTESLLIALSQLVQQFNNNGDAATTTSFPRSLAGFPQINFAGHSGFSFEYFEAPDDCVTPDVFDNENAVEF